MVRGVREARAVSISRSDRGARRMLVLLVGPKGSGKSHIGRVLERRLGAHFFHVEPLWMAYYAECRRAGREPGVPEGIARVHPRIAEELRAHDLVCVETTGASPEILDGLLSLAPPSERLVVRVAAPLEVCLERIAVRDPSVQIPMDPEMIRRVHALSETADVPMAFTVTNTDLTDDAIAEVFRRALASRSNPVKSDFSR